MEICDQLICLKLDQSRSNQHLKYVLEELKSE